MASNEIGNGINLVKLSPQLSNQPATNVPISGCTGGGAQPITMNSSLGIEYGTLVDALTEAMRRTFDSVIAQYVSVNPELVSMINSNIRKTTSTEVPETESKNVSGSEVDVNTLQPTLENRNNFDSGAILTGHGAVVVSSNDVKPKKNSLEIQGLGGNFLKNKNNVNTNREEYLKMLKKEFDEDMVKLARLEEEYNASSWSSSTMTELIKEFHELQQKVAEKDSNRLMQRNDPAPVTSSVTVKLEPREDQYRPHEDQQGSVPTKNISLRNLQVRSINAAARRRAFFRSSNRKVKRKHADTDDDSPRLETERAKHPRRVKTQEIRYCCLNTGQVCFRHKESK